MIRMACDSFFGIVAFAAILLSLAYTVPDARAQDTNWETVSEKSCTNTVVTKRRVVGAYELDLTEDLQCAAERKLTLDIRPLTGVLGIRRIVLNYVSTVIEIDERTLGQDISGSGHPYLAITTCGVIGPPCNTSFFLVELGEKARELINISLNLGEAELVPIAGTAHWAIRIREHWPSGKCTSCGAFPISVLRYDGSRYVADPDLMRRPMDAAAEAEERAKLREAFLSPYGFDESTANDLLARLIYTGNMASACRIVDEVWPADGAVSDKTRIVDDLLTFVRNRRDEDARIPGLASAIAVLNGVPAVSDLACPTQR